MVCYLRCLIWTTIKRYQLYNDAWGLSCPIEFVKLWEEARGKCTENEIRSVNKGKERVFV
jgi:hypothetical protein